MMLPWQKEIRKFAMLLWTSMKRHGRKLLAAGEQSVLFYKSLSQRHKVRLLPLVGWLAATCSTTSTEDWKNTTRTFEKRVIA